MRCPQSSCDLGQYLYHVVSTNSYIFFDSHPQPSPGINRLWTELGACFGAIAKNGNVRVVVLSGAGKMFTAGLDLGDIGFLFAEMEGSRKAAAMRQHVIDFQDAFTSIERCPQPVIAAVHAACIGGGVDLITACDVRLCSADAYFCVKEVDLGLAADVGTLQRLGKVIGARHSNAAPVMPSFCVSTLALAVWH